MPSPGGQSRCGCWAWACVCSMPVAGTSSWNCSRRRAAVGAGVRYAGCTRPTKSASAKPIGYALLPAPPLLVFRPEAQRFAFGGPEAQLLEGGEVPALDLAQGLEKARFLFHQRRRAELAGAAQLAEAQLLVLQLVGAEPVVAAGAAVGATLGIQGQGQVAVVDQGPFTYPFHLVGAFTLQLQGLGGAAEQADSNQGQAQVLLHGASCWHVGQRWRLARLCQPSSWIRASAAGARGFFSPPAPPPDTQLNPPL